MDYYVAYHTDVGLRKHTNQDSLAVKMMDTPKGRAVLAIVCDGMGGLSDGELASKEVITAYCKWFDTEFVQMAQKGQYQVQQIQEAWRTLAIEENKKLGIYGVKQQAGLGTTLSGILIYQNQYIVVQVGDSRIYELTTQGISQVTQDQSVVAREIAEGRLTPEEAKTDSRRSILLQCIGASPSVEPVFYQGRVTPETSYLVCSDGLCHEISTQELWTQLGPQACVDAAVMRQNCIYVTDLVKQRKEQDNISVVAIKAY